MTGIILIGGGGHCKAAIDVIEAEGRFSIAGILEQADAKHTEVLGYPVLGTDGDLSRFLERYPAALITIGQVKTSQPRARTFAAAEAAGAELPTLISPRAHVSPHACVGAGTLVMHGVVVNAAARVGRNCILNSLSLVEHDAIVGDHCHISTGARVNGDVIVEEGCFIGSGAVLKNGITIGAGSVIGAGCLIRHNIPSGSFLKETPKRPI
jgi:sugar O-acyltransferase (sialic acid O-acetyltransferase NeuD family)